MNGFVKAMLLLVWTCPLLAAEDGAALFAQHCAQCHDSGAARIPTRTDLAHLSRRVIIRALSGGKMKIQGAERTPAERAALAAFLSKDSEAADPTTITTFCSSKAPLDLASRHWNGWGASVTNNRFQPAESARLAAADVPKLRLKWAFGFPNETSAAVQPTVVGNWVFVASTAGRIYALDLDQGCVYWTFDADLGVRTAVTIANVTGSGADTSAIFMDTAATVYSLDAKTGQLLWKRQAGSGTAGGTGSPVVYSGRVYVPLSGGGEGDGGEGCCQAHGAVTALDARTGEVLWLSSTLDQEPQPTHKSESGAQMYGPSGASVWSSPTIDAATGRLYLGTGDGHSTPAGPTSDSILAYDLRSGERAWTHQATQHDAYNGGCDRQDKKGCPDENGPDWDFGQPPALVNLGKGKRLLVAGQKSGFVYGLDPDHGGRELWKVHVATGGVLGGVNWGVATDERNVYVAVSDHLDLVARDAKLGPTAGGLLAIRLADGKQLWRTQTSGCSEHQGFVQPSAQEGARIPMDFGCSPAQSAAVTVIPGVVFSGSLDGHLRAYAANNGRVLWDFDTARDFLTVNYLHARGGSIDVGGPAVVNATVLTTSGYSSWGGMPGNVLLAFAVPAAPH